LKDPYDLPKFRFFFISNMPRIATAIFTFTEESLSLWFRAFKTLGFHSATRIDKVISLANEKKYR